MASQTDYPRPEGNPPSPLGFLTAYVPEELFHAAGLTPVFIFHAPDDRGHARACLPSFTCWVAGSALDQALAGDLDHLAGMALAKTCDATQGLADLWQPNVPHVPLFHFGMPLRLDSSSARAYLLAELESLRARIQTVTGRSISDESLRESIKLYNRTRALVRQLYARAASPAGVPPGGESRGSASALYELVRAAFQMPKDAYNDHVAQVLDRPSASPSDMGQERLPRVLLVGPVLGDPALFDVLDQAGARVVGDLLDLGERYFAMDAAEDGHPLEALADRLLALVPTPTKHHPQRTREAHLLALVSQRRADGVIFARQKFCEPHGFDYAQLAHALDESGVPNLLIELEQASQAGQVRTRVEAFVEMITG